MDANTLIKLLFNSNGNIDFNSLFYIFIIIFFIWTYKESRKSYIEIDKSFNEDINKKLDIYSKLLFSLINYKNDSESLETFEQNIINAYSHLPKYLVKKIYLWKNDKKEVLDELKEDLNNEILDLKCRQKPLLSSKEDENVFDMISSFFYKYKLNTFIYPIFYSFFFLVSVLTIILISIETHYLDNFEKNIFFVFMMNLLFLFFIVLVLFDLIMRQKFIHTIKNYFSILLLLVLPFVLSITWKIGFIFVSLISNIIYIVCFLKKAIKSNK